MKVFFSTAMLMLLALTEPVKADMPASAGGSLSRPAIAPAASAVRIILVGASTVAPYTGWGGSFCARHVSEIVACLNLAWGGRSTRSYRAEGFWDLVLEELKVVGYRTSYVLIEMGHNDKSINPAVATDLRTEFPGNLRRFIAEARAFGAIPVLVTPLSTRHFKKGHVFNTLRLWAEQVRIVADETGVPIVDLNAESAALFQRLGAAVSMSFSAVPPTEVEFEAALAGTTLPARLSRRKLTSGQVSAGDPRLEYTQDYLHLNDKGADVISAMVAARLVAVVPELRAVVVP